MKSYNVIGLMSGTSLDGVDIAYCQFHKSDYWQFSIEKSQTIPYSEIWQHKIQSWYKADLKGLKKADLEYGTFLGHVIKDFVRINGLSPDFIASHGHTVLHQPEKGITKQIGCGNTIAEITNLPVVYDFRSKDVKLGGQGAPLVPIGDRLLFKEFNYCLNLGGFANVSFEHEGKRVAYDICPVNIVLNQLCQQLNKPFDKDGDIARAGTIVPSMLEALNALDYYKMPFPKSLGREWVDEHVIPIIDFENHKTQDLISTWTHHAAHQIGRAISKAGEGNILITGGGALNKYLVDLIQKQTNLAVKIPDEDIVHFKEAFVFAFLGVLRWRNEVNCLSSVTGARSDSSSGKIAIAKKK